MCYVMSVGIRELRQNLSVYIRRVQRGEALQVTEHGKPVALLAPLPRADDPLADLLAAGRLIPASRSFDELPRPIKLPPGSPSATETVLAMRDEEDRGGVLSRHFGIRETRDRRAALEAAPAHGARCAVDRQRATPRGGPACARPAASAGPDSSVSKRAA